MQTQNLMEQKEQYIVGIDVGGTTVKIGMFRADGTLADKWEIPTDTADNGIRILPDIAASVRTWLGEYTSAGSQDGAESCLAGAGICVPGAVLPGGIVNRCVNLGWGVVPVAEELSRLLPGIPVRVFNDADAAALGEVWRGGGSGSSSMVMITLGTGVGGGIIVNGGIVSGAFGGAGEIGHIPVRDDEEEVCGCGKRGCLEQYTSASGFARQTRKLLAKTNDPSSLRSLEPERVTSRAIFKAADAGDAFAKERIEELGRILGKALAGIAAVVDPEVFVIGGGMSGAGDVLIDVIRKNYRELVFHTSRDTAFTIAELGNDAGMYGTVRDFFSREA